ncbi:YjeJ family protein [Trabulsiella odontotermitis]|uniref:YjeJ family protein n=1 Tax=Trabulsiella odontotermitis TaxID=379893 RepID=UPI003AC80089
MLLMIKGINTGVIRHDNNFLALALKVKYQRNKEAIFFFPPLVLRDVLIALEHRLFQHASLTGLPQEQLERAKRSAVKKMHGHIPELTGPELAQADISRRVESVALTENSESHLLFTLTMNDEAQTQLCVEETQIELLVIAIVQAINNAGMHELAIRLSSLLDFLPLYDVDCRETGELEYDSYDQPDWKQTLFSHYLALIYRFSDHEGKDFTCGAVIKTRSNPDSEEAKAISRRLMNFSPRLSKLKGRACQVFIRAIPHTPQQALSLEQCLRALHHLRASIPQN